MTEMIERRGLLVPVDVDEQDRRAVDLHVVSDVPVDGQHQADVDGDQVLDGYTPRVRELEAAAAEAERVRALPTARVLARRQEQAEAETLAELAAAEHARKLSAAGARERAELAARAASAAAKRRLEADVDVRALGLSRRRVRWSLLCWSVLLAALSYTCTSVQQFAAAGAPAGTAQWAVAWAVDPVLSLLLVGLLLARGDLTVVGVRVRSLSGHRLVLWAEIGVLAAVLTMNVSPVILSAAPWELIALHVAVPGAAATAALVLPIVQQWYATAISGLYQAMAADPSGRPDTPINRDKHAPEAAAVAELSAVDRELLADVREAIRTGEITHPPSAYVIHKRVMGGHGDKAKASRVAAVLAGGAS